MRNCALQVGELIFSVRPTVIESLYYGALCYGSTEARASLRVYMAPRRDHVNLGSSWSVACSRLIRALLEKESA